MNRLPFTAAPTLESPKSSLGKSHASFLPALGLSETTNRTPPRGASRHYSLFAPLHYERGYAYPLLVWLHGEGGNERELRQVMPHVSVRNHIAASARGSAIVEGRRGYTWLEGPQAVSEAFDAVAQCMDAARRRYNIHAERIFIAGYGAGGTMALRLALQMPEWFAGAISLDGPMPCGHNPLGRVNEARRLPLLLACCRDSTAYPSVCVADDLRLLHAAGFSLALRQYPGGHDLTTLMLADMDRWMIQQFCPETAGASL